MIVIPDLFGAYQKGRETAIDANWKDLQNYESIENARHQNDSAALANLATMADFGKQRRLTDNQVTNSDLNTEYNVEAQIGKLNNASIDGYLTGINRAVLEANPEYITDLMTNNLGTVGLNAKTGYLTADTDLQAADIINRVTTKHFPDSLAAADAAMGAKNSIQMINAQFGPAMAKQALEAQWLQGLITKEEYEQRLLELEGRRPYVYGTSQANARAGLITAQNSVGQAEVNGKIISQQNKTVEFTNQLAQLTQAYQTEVALAGPDTPRAKDLAKRISEVQNKLAQAAGVTGSIAPYTPTSVPVVDPNTGGYLGSMDTATGAVTRASTTGNLFPASPPVRTPSQIAVGDIGRNTVMTGTPLIAIGTPTTKQTNTATHYLPNGQRVVTSTPVRTPTTVISPSQLNYNLQNRKGGVL